MSPLLNCIADLILILMLGGTLAMAVRLDRALRTIGRERAVFENLISDLGAATNSVKLGIQSLRTEAERAATQIERRSEEADKIATDLSFLVEAADRAGAKLEQQLTSVPKTAVAENRMVATARRLIDARQYILHRRAKPGQRRPHPLVPSQPALQKATGVAAEPLTAALPPNTLEELHELAGITTRRRAVEQDGSSPANRAQLDQISAAALSAQAGRDTTHIKLVG